MALLSVVPRPGLSIPSWLPAAISDARSTVLHLHMHLAVTHHVRLALNVYPADAVGACGVSVLYSAALQGGV